MSFLDKIKNKVEQAKSNAEIFWASDQLMQERISICHQCEHYFKPTTTCKKCGCIMAVKTKLKQAACPVGKW
jgi:protein-arginine kinase activator protein McsA